MAVCCGVLHQAQKISRKLFQNFRSVLPGVTAHIERPHFTCSMLQRVVVCCSALQSVAEQCSVQSDTPLSDLVVREFVSGPPIYQSIHTRVRERKPSLGASS